MLGLYSFLESLGMNLLPSSFRLLAVLHSLWLQDWGPCSLAGCQWGVVLSFWKITIFLSSCLLPVHFHSQQLWVKSFSHLRSLCPLLLPHLFCLCLPYLSDSSVLLFFYWLMWLDCTHSGNSRIYPYFKISYLVALITSAKFLNSVAKLALYWITRVTKE